MKPNLTKYKFCSRAKGEIHAYKAQIFFTSDQVFQEEYAEAAKEDLTLTIRIETMATVNPDADLDEGIKAPSTGDNQSMVLWIALGAAALCLLAFLLYFKRREQEEETDQRNADLTFEIMGRCITFRVC